MGLMADLWEGHYTFNFSYTKVEKQTHHHSAVLLAKKQLLHNGIQIHRTLSMLLLALASMSLVSIMQSVMGRIDKSGKGVYLQASTLGSLEPILLERVLLRS
ncbi:hypothetical protein V6N12_001283 [Hibiscus sabdariffa]|uniref:Uncharacterized protein n=1 Tax=Hibiscus sabdariffa TaxID=183260 RepID=A0ABR2C6T5_9ROSI